MSFRGKWLCCLPALLAAGTVFGETPDPGAAVYAVHCVACHQPEGEGAAGIAPPLSGTLANRAKHPDGLALLARILISGMNGPIVSQGIPYNSNMPSFAARTDEELLAVLDFVMKRFNEGAPVPGPELFAAARAKPMTPGDVRKLRQQVLAKTGE